MKNKYFFFLLFFSSIGTAFAQNTWLQKASFGGGERYAATGFSIGTKGFIGTGYDDSLGMMKKDFWEWDQTTNAWTQKADFAGGKERWFAVGFSIGNKGYMGTGYDSSMAPTNDFWEYDTTLNTWTQKANVGGPLRACAIGFSIGNKGYTGTGNNIGTPNFICYQDFWEYDPSSDTWTQKANFGGGFRTNATGISIGTKGYVGLGIIGSFPTLSKDFWEFDPSSDSWNQRSDFAGGKRAFADGFSIGTFGYIGAGEDSTQHTYYDFWQFDPTLNVWTQKANIPHPPPLCSAVCFSIGNKGYLGTGGPNPAIQSYRSFYEYTPSPAGIEEFSKTSVNIFPDPFTTSATFDLSKELKNAQLKLFDVTGKEMRSINFSGKQITLQRENLESGIYFYQIVSEEKNVLSGKIIVE